MDVLGLPSILVARAQGWQGVFIYASLSFPLTFSSPTLLSLQTADLEQPAPSVSARQAVQAGRAINKAWGRCKGSQSAGTDP